MTHETFVLRERPLTDDMLHLAADGRVFKGGYRAVVVWHEFANPWGDYEHVKRFRSVDSMSRWLKKKYTDEELELVGL